MISELKKSRDSPVVLKHRLVELRGSVPRSRIFVFEGDDDKIVYYSWIEKVHPGLVYESFCCRGKKRVLQLRDIVQRDKSNLEDAVYFFVDYDFDGLQGRNDGDDLFITEAYSVENYLVTENVLDSILSTNFHCNGHPDTRGIILLEYRRLLDIFLEHSKEANFQIYLSRVLEIPLKSQLPNNCNKIAAVDLKQVHPREIDLSEWVELQKAPSSHDVMRLRKEFESIVPQWGYRGKFILDFFMKWLEKLGEDYRSENPIFFQGIDRRSKARTNENVIGVLATKAKPPVGLDEFIRGTSEKVGA